MATANKDVLTERAAAAGVDVSDDPNKDDLVARLEAAGVPTDAEDGGDTSGSGDTRTATEIAAAAAADQGIQPIDLPHTAAVADDAPRAPKRGVYINDANAANRVVVAAGDPIPSGFSLADDRDLRERAENTATVHPDVGADTGAGTGGRTE